MEWLKKQHRALWQFYRADLGEWLLMTAAAFLVICLLAFGVGVINKNLPEVIINYFNQLLQANNVVSDDGGINLPALLGNNLRATLVAAALGIVPFVYLTVLPLAMNAVVIGAVLAASSAMGAGLWQMVVLGLLPHGVFELPAILLGMAMGLRLCAGLSAAIRKKPGAPRPEELLPQLVRQYVCFCLPLLTVAAVVETFVTPVLMGLAL